MITGKHAVTAVYQAETSTAVHDESLVHCYFFITHHFKRRGIMMKANLKVLLAVSVFSLVLCFSSISSATTTTVSDTGQDPATDLIDGANGWDARFVFRTALSTPFPTETIGTVTQFEFFADQGTTGRKITPILYSSIDSGSTFSVLGLGTTYTIGTSPSPPGDGQVNTLPFGLTGGTATFDTTTPLTTYYLGFHATDLNGNSATTGGVVPFENNGLGGPQSLFRSESLPGVGSNPATDAAETFTGNRTYAYNFDIDFVGAPVPEPSTFALAALALLGLSFCTWRRRRRA